MVLQATLKREDILKNQGNAQLFVTDEVANGLTIAPTLNKTSQTGRLYKFYTRSETSKEVFDGFFAGEPIETSKGAQLTEVSGVEHTPEGIPLLSQGFRYIVLKEDYEESPESFLMDIEDFSYVISAKIEQSCYDAAIAAAPTAGTKAALHDGPWDDSTEIAEDLRGFRADMRSRGVKGPLDTLFYESDNYDELGNFIIRTEGIQNLREENDVIQYGSIGNTYAENGPANGTTFGWSSKALPGTIVYRTIPGAYTPIKAKEGTKDTLPIINMKIIESEGDGLEKVLDIRFGAHWAVAMTRPDNIFKQTGI